MKPNKKVFIYIYSLFFITFLLFTYLFFNFKFPTFTLILFWAFISIVIESLPIVLPNNNIAVSVGSAVNVATIIIGGPILATLVSALGFLFRVPYIPHKKSHSHILNTPYYMTMFNVFQGIIVTGIMSLSYLYLGGIIGDFHLIQTISILFIGALLNSVIISILMTLLQSQNLIRTFVENVKGILLNTLAVGTIGIIIALSFIGYGYLAVLLFLGPLLLARYSFKLYVEMRNFNIATIQTLSKALEAKDPYTSGHSVRVEEYAVKLASAYGLGHKKIENIRTAAILHDIGKIGIKDSILNKADKLTQDEFAEIMTHPNIGAEIISKIDVFREITPIVRHHHEKYDGSGYPGGLQKDKIPLEACILTIADSFDAMTSDRPYRDGLETETALIELEKNAGSQFHPKLVEKFILMIREEEVVSECF